MTRIRFKGSPRWLVWTGRYLSPLTGPPWDDRRLDVNPGKEHSLWLTAIGGNGNGASISSSARVHRRGGRRLLHVRRQHGWRSRPRSPAAAPAAAAPAQPTKNVDHREAVLGHRRSSSATSQALRRPSPPASRRSRPPNSPPRPAPRRCARRAWPADARSSRRHAPSGSPSPRP